MRKAQLDRLRDGRDRIITGISCDRGHEVVAWRARGRVRVRVRARRCARVHKQVRLCSVG